MQKDWRQLTDEKTVDYNNPSERMNKHLQITFSD